MKKRLGYAFAFITPAFVMFLIVTYIQIIVGKLFV